MTKLAAFLIALRMTGALRRNHLIHGAADMGHSPGGFCRRAHRERRHGLDEGSQHGQRQYPRASASRPVAQAVGPGTCHFGLVTWLRYAVGSKYTTCITHFKSMGPTRDHNAVERFARMSRSCVPILEWWSPAWAGV